MPPLTRPALLTSVASACWLLASPFAHAASTPAEPPAAAVEQDAVAPAPAGSIVLAQNDTSSAPPMSSSSTQVMAVTPVDPGRWQFSVGPYLWMASVKSTVQFTPVRTGSTINATVDDSFGKILGDLNFAFMTDAEARRGLFSVRTDFIYVNLLATGSRVSDVSGPRGRVVPINTGSKVRLEELIWSMTGGYDVFRNDRAFIQLFAGFRLLSVSSKLDWNFTGPTGDFARAGTVKESDNIWDGIVGARGEVALGDGPWKLVYYGDVGSGTSDFTWQAAAQVAYVTSWGDIGLGYRYLDYQPGGDKVVQDLSMKGPMLTFHYRFGG